MADAFDLRLFASFIRKVDNADDYYIEDIEGSPEAGIVGSQRKSFQSTYLPQLWRYYCPL